MLRRAAALAGLITLCLPAVPAHAVSTHTFVGVDRTDPKAWGKTANWDDQQLPAAGDIVIIGDFRVTDVPGDRTFASVTITEGASLETGGPLSTAILTAGCATTAIDISIGGVADIYGLNVRPTGADAPVTITNNGVMTVRRPLPIIDNGCVVDTSGVSGKLALFSSATLVNLSELRGNGTVLGMVCCTDPQVLRNSATGVIDGTDGITLDSLRLEHRGRIRNGTVSLNGGTHLLTATSRFENVLLSADGATIDVGPPGAATATPVNLATGATFALFGGSQIFGRGSWTGPGVLALREGFIYGRQELGATTTLSISGPDAKVIKPFSTGDPGEVVVNGSLELATGPLTIGGRLVVHGTARVARGATPALSGSLCCNEPVNALRIDPGARLELARTSVLTISDMRLDNAGTVAAPTAGTGPLGRLVLDSGSHILRDGSELGAPTELLDLALVAPVGTSTVSAAVKMTKGQLAGPVAGRTTPRAILGGSGSWRILEGTVSGDVTFRKPLAVTVTGPAQKVVGGGADIRMQGATRIEGPGELRITSGARLALAGTTTLDAALVDAGSCCTNPAELDLAGPVKLADDSAASTLAFVATRILDAVDLNGRVLVINGLPASVASGGRVRLGGGTLRSDADVQVRDGAELVGPGTVVAATLRLSGTSRLASRGRLLVRGSLRLAPSSVVRMQATARARDRLEVTGGALLDGELALRGTALLPRRVTWVVVRMDDRIGTFDRVTGRAGNPVSYDLHTVRI